MKLFLIIFAVEIAVALGGTVLPKPQADVDKKVFRICRQKPPSRCRGSQKGAYFDIQSAKCTLFNYGKCERNEKSENHFDSLEACELSCSKVPPCPPAEIVPPPNGCSYKIVSEPDYVMPYCPYPKLSCPTKDFFCPDYNRQEEKTYSLSCEFLLDSLYDLEMDAISGDENEADFDDPKTRKTRQTNAVKKLMEKARKSGKSIFAEVVGRGKKAENSKKSGAQTPLDAETYPPFYPRPDISREEEKARKNVCSALLSLPGVKTRCCTTLSWICPDFANTEKGKKTIPGTQTGTGPDSLEPPPGKPPPPKSTNSFNNIVSELSAFLKKLLSG